MSAAGKTPAPAASDEFADDTGGTSTSDTGADTTAAGDETDEDSSTEVLSVKVGADGTFTLIQGDDEASEDDAGSPDAGAAPEGQSFDDVGKLLKAIADILKSAQSANGGTDDENFDAGYASKAKPSAG